MKNRAIDIMSLGSSFTVLIYNTLQISAIHLIFWQNIYSV